MVSKASPNPKLSANLKFSQASWLLMKFVSKFLSYSQTSVSVTKK